MSNTAVPIRPIAKGSIAKLWAGVAIVAAVAGGLAWAGTNKVVGQSCSSSLMLPEGKAASAPETTDSGLVFQVRSPGKGASPTDADMVLISYKGSLADGKEFESNQQAPMSVSSSVPGFSEALKKMQRGGSYRLCIPPALAYGKQAVGPITANSLLVFDVELLDFRNEAEIRMMQQMMQQQQKQLQQQGGGAATPQMP
ncbi:MAG: hypothetical protein RIT52_2581 [Pseudomonadota bacterium]